MNDQVLTDGILVSPTCFRQRVNLPAAQVAGLSEAELAAALAFEIEPFSGIPRAAGEMAWRACAEDDAARRAFDVVQIRQSDLAAELKRAQAAKLRVKFVTAEPDAARGETAADLPKIAVRRPGALRARPLALWCGVCLLLLAGAAYEGFGLWRDMKGLRRDVAERRALQAEKDGLESRLAGLRRQAAEIRRVRGEEAAAQARAAVLRAAGRELLEAVPAACADESVVRGIAAGENDFEVRLSGVALSAEAATRTVSRLAAALAARKSGWTLKPGSQGVQAEGGSCAFDCVFAFDPERSGR